jgi:CelD/BcsL family acetyltransferase involved in cellulose biosynthesis
MNAHLPLKSAVAAQLEIASTPERLAEIGPAWTVLWQQVGRFIFQHPSWTEAWWHNLPDKRSRNLRIGLIWNGDLLLAVIPLATTRRKGVRILEWAANSYSDYCDILVHPACPNEELGHLWKKLSASRGYDLIFLNRLLPDSAMQTLLLASRYPGISLYANRRQEVSYRVSGDWRDGASWLADQPKKVRQEFRRHQRILAESGALCFRLVGPNEDIDQILERVAELKRANLAATNRSSELFDEGSSTLLAVGRALAQVGMLRLFVLECDGIAIAVSINFVFADTMMAYVTTYDPAFSRGSPGDVLMMEYIQWCFDNGYRTIDFLCGGERFKRKFATTNVTLSSVVGSVTIIGSLALTCDTIANRLLHLGRKSQ